MSRGLRGSNSVCGRIIQKENFSFNDNANAITGEDSQDTPQTQTLQSANESNTGTTGRKRKRRIAQVLDVAESARCGHEKFIPFKERLHPWTTIKVSNFRLNMEPQLLPFQFIACLRFTFAPGGAQAAICNAIRV